MVASESPFAWAAGCSQVSISHWPKLAAMGFWDFEGKDAPFAMAAEVIWVVVAISFQVCPSTNSSENRLSFAGGLEEMDIDAGTSLHIGCVKGVELTTC